VVAVRKHTLLPLDDCLYAMNPTIPHLTRSSLHRCLQRYGIWQLPHVEGGASPKRKFKDDRPFPYLAEVRTAQGRLTLIVSPLQKCRDRTSALLYYITHLHPQNPRFLRLGC
jgi:hypothetical protein